MVGSHVVAGTPWKPLHECRYFSVIVCDCECVCVEAHFFELFVGWGIGWATDVVGHNIEIWSKMLNFNSTTSVPFLLSVKLERLMHNKVCVEHFPPPAHSDSAFLALLWLEVVMRMTTTTTTTVFV